MSRRWMYQAAVALGHLQALGTGVFAVMVGVSSRHTQGWSITGAKGPISVSLVLEYAVFALGMEAVALGLQRGRTWALTPFLVVQLFLIIAIGWTLAQSDTWRFALAGVAIILMSLAAMAGAVFGRPRSSP